MLRNGFDTLRVIGDVHGNLDGLQQAIQVPHSTFLLFLGDLIDYDPRGIEVVDIVYDLMMDGRAMSLQGNHEMKIANYVRRERTEDGFQGKLTHGNQHTADALAAMNPQRRQEWEDKFLDLVSKSPDWVEIGRHMFTHGAVHPEMWGNQEMRGPKKKGKSKVSAYAMFGQTSGKFVDGYPERLYTWVDDLPHQHSAVVGHDIRSREAPMAVHGKGGGNALFLDTGSSKEGFLSWADYRITDDGLELLDIHSE